MYQETTESIVITVYPKFLPEASVPHTDHYTWSYHVEIRNEGKGRVQLINRYWHITDANGRIREVRGAGVVGVQPVLEPGDGFEYNSFVPLPTPSGMMSGTYEMLRVDGTMFDVAVPAFSLDHPNIQPSLN